MRSRLLREGSYESLGVLAAFENDLRADVTLREMRWEGRRLAIELQATLDSEPEPPVFVRRGARMVWVPPGPLRDELPEEALDATDALAKSQVQVLLRSTKNQVEYAVPTRSEVVFVRGGGGTDVKRPVLIASAEVDARTAAAGSKLAAGEWQVHVLVGVADFTATADGLVRPARFHLPGRNAPKTLVLTATRDGRLIERSELKRGVTRRLPRLTRRVRRLRRRSRAAIGKMRRRVAA
jgi:hypothetical protein